MNAKHLLKRFALPLLLTATLIVGAFLIGRLTSKAPAGDHAPSPPITQASLSGGEQEAGDGERKILYWRAPMDPNEIYDRPGKSRMGMDLVPVYEDEVGAEGVVSIDPVTTQNIGVRTAPVEVEALRRTVRTTGRFESDERAWTTVSLKVGGWVEKLFVDFEGARVRKGQPLLELYSPELVSTQEEYLLALRNARRMQDGTARTDAQRLLEAARRRLAYWDITDEQIRRLEETGVPQKTLTLFAPSGGYVTQKQVTEGQRVMPGQTLMEIADLSRIWLMVDVYEQDLAWVGVGTMAQVDLPYEPGRRRTGRVDYVYDMLDPQTRIVKARVTLPNPGWHFKPGMYATVQLTGGEAAPTPVVPEEAIVRSGQDELVILALGEGRFRPVPVRSGAQADGQVQILEGLRGGERVVTSAQFLIDSEARLKSAITSLMAGSDAEATNPEERELPSTPDTHADAEHRAAAATTAGHDTATAPLQHGKQVVEIAIEPSGFAPHQVEVQAGVPVRMVFTRTTDATCAKQVQIPAFGIENTDLPLHQAVEIAFTPETSGTFTFACGMDMLKGTLIVTA